MTNDAARRERLLLCAVCALCVFRVSFLGFSYTPYLDDYVQYFYYPTFENPWQEILMGGAGTMRTRPLAALCDFFVLSAFGSHLGLAVLAEALLFGLSAVLFFKAFSEAKLDVTPVFLAAYAFVPLNIEGVYWLSASSRIVTSQFLTALSCLMLVRGRAVPFAVFQFLSVWFYEQTAVLSVCAAAGLIILERKRLWRLAVPITSALALAAYYLAFGMASDNAERMSMVGAETFFPNASVQLGSFSEIFFGVHSKIITRGFVRGMERIVSERAYVWLAVMIALCVSVLVLQPRYEKRRADAAKAVFGAYLAAAPLLPFFISRGNLPNLRSTVPSMVGIALVLDAALPRILRSAAPIAVCLSIFVFSIAAVSEVCDYERTAQVDFRIAQKLAAELPTDSDIFEFSPVTPKYYPQNAPLRDHIVSMTGTDWGVTGIVRTLSGRRGIVIEVR